MADSFQKVLNFWFGSYVDEVSCANQQSKLWWGKDPKADRQIKENFESDLHELVQGQRDDWLHTPQARLGAIIVLDQFSRNIYRDTVQAFTQDNLALQLCRDGLASGTDLSLRPLEKVFFYLPLEHAESIELQVLSVELFKNLRNDVLPENRDLFNGYVDFAERHKSIIERFGRFPHRNAAMGRKSTSEEVEFLLQPGSGF